MKFFCALLLFELLHLLQKFKKDLVYVSGVTSLLVEIINFFQLVIFYWSSKLFFHFKHDWLSQWNCWKTQSQHWMFSINLMFVLSHRWSRYWLKLDVGIENVGQNFEIFEKLNISLLNTFKIEKYFFKKYGKIFWFSEVKKRQKAELELNLF